MQYFDISLQRTFRKTLATLTLALGLITSSSASADMAEAPNFEAIEAELLSLDQDALVVFDVDFTLIVPEDKMLRPSGEKYLREITQEKLRGYSKEKIDELTSQVMLQSRVRLTDVKSLELLDLLQQKGIKTVALTAIRTGEYGAIPSMEDWRVQQLRRLGIDFAYSFPGVNPIVFSEFQGKGPSPAFSQGIICTVRYKKGQVLKAFLEHLNWKPSKVVFVDDRLDCLQSVETEMDLLGIPTMGFLYTAETGKNERIDEEIADFQINTLLEEGRWLSDDDAALELNMFLYGGGV